MLPTLCIALALGFAISHTVVASSGFPKSGNGLWYTEPGTGWSKTWLPIGNGYLAGKFSIAKTDGTQG
jgi:alpha-L-fucosidase 2